MSIEKAGLLLMKFILSIFLAFTVACASTGKAGAEAKTETPKKDEEKIAKPAAENSVPGAAKTVRADEPKEADKKFDEVGYSSWYGEQFQNKPTASGEPFDRFKLTGAHRTLPFGSEVKIQNLENNKETVVRINDRGPFNKARIIDISEKAAEALDFKDSGIARVGISVVKKTDKKPVKEKDDFSFDEEDDDDDDDLDDDDVPSAPKKDTKPAPNTVKPVPEKTVPEKKPTVVKPVPAKETKPATTTAATEGEQPKGLSVQIGVFKEKMRAENFRSQIKASFTEPVFMFNRNGTYVVQIGDFSSRTDAMNLKEKLKAKGIFGFIPPK